jgi:DNA (cytosine-5)-methyltransferase 1
MNELALFAGGGGGILAGHMLGWRCVAAVEIEDYPRRVLLQRQADGLLPRFPIWDDIRTFDGKPWRGRVQVVTGGFPCQDISISGKGDGLEGERSSMWYEMARVVSEVLPRFVFVENSPMLTLRGGVRVIADLTAMGYDTRWTVMGAADVGAPHQRERMWILATHTNSINDALRGNGKDNAQALAKRRVHAGGGVSDSGTGCEEISGQGQSMADTERQHGQQGNSGGVDTDTQIWTHSAIHTQPSITGLDRKNWQAEPKVDRVADGVANGMDRLKAIGNGQVPLCAATAWRILNDFTRSP